MRELANEAAAQRRGALDRRGFLKTLGGGLLVLFTLDDEASAQESGGARNRFGGNEKLPENVQAWLHIAPDGAVTAFTGKVEVGQNIRTSLTQAVADELRCAPAQIKLVMGDTALTPWDAGTFGSRTTPTMAPIMHKMAASAREALVDAAAGSWGVDRRALQISNGCVTHTASGKKAGIGLLAGGVDWVNVLGNADLITSPEHWQVAGTSLPKVNAHEIATGKHRYSSDHKLDGMLYGRVLRPPSFGAKLTSIDVSAAERMPGVSVVRDGDFVGVAALNEHVAAKALESMQAKWEEQPQISSGQLFSYIKADANEANSAEPVTLKSTYAIAYIAHTPLEPRAAVAQWIEGKLTVWTGTQRPFGVRSELAHAFAVPEDQVHVIMPDTGSGYGGKHSGECAVEAARLAKATGKPVKLIWTREEEFTWAYFRPAGVIEIRSGVDKDGVLTDWEFHNYMSGPSGLQTPYEVANKNEHFHQVKSPLRDGSYRGLAATANHFARESHMDELAAHMEMDPLAFRMKNLKNERLRVVLAAATDRFAWKQQKPSSRRGFGLACGVEKGGYVACCAEISLGPQRQVKVERVVTAWECGGIVNPEHLKNQVEGAVVMGLGGALFEAIDFANGRILNAQLSKYRVPRFSDAPKIEVLLIDRKDIPSAGAGETPIVGIAPAIANAIYSATQVRVRAMPILPAFAQA